MFWLFGAFWASRDPSIPDGLHRYRFPYKPWVYLTPHEAIAGYGISAALVMAIVLWIVLTERGYRAGQR